MTNINSEESNNTIGHQSTKDKVKAIVLFTTSGDDALSVLRVLGPAHHSGIEVIRGVTNGIIQYERILEGDVIVLQRDFSRDLDSYENIIKLAHDQAKPVVMDLDDLLLDLPENHPDRISNYFVDSLLPMLQSIIEADLVTVATHSLRDNLIQYNRNVKVFQNYLNDQLWKIIKPSTNGLSDDHISIGYMGGHSHKPDIQMVSEVLIKILNKFDHKIKFKFWGIEPPEELAPYSHVDWYPPKSLEYHEFVKYFQTQSADIMIAPLIDTEFNRCKSHIKYLEYSALGVPGVYSKITPYESIVEDGIDGFLASSSIEWEEALSKLIEDKILRGKIAFNAQKKVRQHWLLLQNAYKYKDLYENLVENFAKNKSGLPPLHPIVKSVTRQIYEGNRPKNQQMEQLNSQIIELKKIINQLNDQKEYLNNLVNEREEEALSYALSKSWQITRPLRRVSRKIREVAR